MRKNSSICWLHVGLEKTGTTSIQRFLSNNKKALLKRGYLHPKCLCDSNHSRISIFAGRKELTQDLCKYQGLSNRQEISHFLSEFRKKLVNEVKKKNPKNVVISDEHCSSRLLSSKDLEALRDLLLEFSKSIKVLMYIRRQDEFLLSSYSTSIISGSSSKLIIPKDPMQLSWVHERYDYLRLIRRWEKIFGKENIHIRIFEPSQLIEGDVVKDFISILGLSSKDFKFPDIMNKSLNADALCFLRILNSRSEKLNPVVRNRIIRTLQSLPTDIKFAVPDLDRFMETFELGNREVAIQYTKTEDGNLFREPFSDKKYDDQFLLSVERSGELSILLINELCKQSLIFC
jgi:hypothetical protein